MSDSRQRHQHGVKKKLVEGIGGVIAGAALVVLLRGLRKRRDPAPAPSAQPSPSSQPISGASA